MLGGFAFACIIINYRGVLILFCLSIGSQLWSMDVSGMGTRAVDMQLSLNQICSSGKLRLLGIVIGMRSQKRTCRLWVGMS